MALQTPKSGALKRRRAPFTRRTRQILAAMSLLVVVLVEYRLSTLPVAIDLAEQWSALPGSDIVLTGVAAEYPLLAYAGQLREAADIRFDRARLSPQTLALLKTIGVELRATEAPISWITHGESASRTIFEVRAVDQPATLAELRLRPLSSAGTGPVQLEIEARGATLEVLIGTPFTPENLATKSFKTLNVGKQKIDLPGAVPIKVLVPAAASFRARFTPVAALQSTQFDLGHLPLNALEEAGLKVHAISVRKTGTSTDKFPEFACASPTGAIAWSDRAALMEGRCQASAHWITASQLHVLGDKLEIAMAGSGWVQRDGAFAGADPLSKIAQNRVLAGILLALNLALIGWLVLEIAGRRLSGPAPRWSGGVFLSYRRGDSASQAGRLFDHLSTHFGADRVFMDVDTIKLGDDFVRKIRDSLLVSDALLAVIGKQWLGAADAEGCRRLDDPEDFVRLEIATALERGAWVIPVLVGGATMPSEAELPQILAPLARRNAIDLNDSRFTLDIKALITALEQGRESSSTENGTTAPAQQSGSASATVDT